MATAQLVSCTIFSQDGTGYVDWDWLSSDTGTVTANSADGAGASIKVVGTLTRVMFKPDGGATTPTTLYDVVVNDAAGLDVLTGLGANLSETTTTTKTITLTDSGGTTLHTGRTVAEVLTLVITNAGDAKGGQVRIYFV